MLYNVTLKVTYGGRLQTGAGMTTGEELELVNSNISRYGFNTKKMTKACKYDKLYPFMFTLFIFYRICQICQLPVHFFILIL